MHYIFLRTILNSTQLNQMLCKAGGKRKDITGLNCLKGVSGSDYDYKETWPERKENEVAPQQTEIRMIRLMCGAKVKEFQVELRERLGLDDIIQQKRV